MDRLQQRNANDINVASDLRVKVPRVYVYLYMYAYMGMDMHAYMCICIHMVYEKMYICISISEGGCVERRGTVFARVWQGCGVAVLLGWSRAVYAPGCMCVCPWVRCGCSCVCGLLQVAALEKTLAEKGQALTTLSDQLKVHTPTHIQKHTSKLTPIQTLILTRVSTLIPTLILTLTLTSILILT